MPAAWSASQAYDALDPRIQQFIWTQGWAELRPVQVLAAQALLASPQDVLIAAATASGKTEAAMFPLLTQLVRAPNPGLVIYVSPLKALINDQLSRSLAVCEALGVPVHPWHGDVGQAAKQRFAKSPTGLLLITPESLEAMLCAKGSQTRRLLGGTRAVVIDELHAFIGEERGKQLQSLMHRIEALCPVRPRRVGLSATLGDMRMAADFMVPALPNKGLEVAIVQAPGTDVELKLVLKGFVEPRAAGDDEAAIGVWQPVSTGQIAEQLYRTLRGSNNLVFPNTRNQVERLAQLLRSRCERDGVPAEFWPHHGSLSRSLREDAERALKDPNRPATAIATSTLELGIDIGSVKSVAQVGCPHSVASLRQRLGRSGRRNGEAAILRMYIAQDELDADSHPASALRWDLVQAAAMVELLLQGWFEPPAAQGLHYSTLVQQLLSLVSQHNGLTAAAAWQTLCVSGVFQGMDKASFAKLLRHMASKGLLEQESTGLLLLGEKAEKLVGHFSFYAAFATQDEYRLMHEGTVLGTVPLLNALRPGDLLVFAGRTWKITDVDDTRKVATVVRSKAHKAPRFESGPAQIHQEVRTRMRALYEQTTVPAWLDATAQSLLAQARAAYRSMGLKACPFVATSTSVCVFPWLSDAAVQALLRLVQSKGLTAYADSGMLEVQGVDVGQLEALFKSLASAQALTGPALLEGAKNLEEQKWDWALPEDLLRASHASLHMDTEAAYAWLREHFGGT